MAAAVIAAVGWAPGMGFAPLAQGLSASWRYAAWILILPSSNGACTERTPPGRS